MIKLNDDQATAMAQILAAFEAGETRHVLTGAAGTGEWPMWCPWCGTRHRYGWTKADPEISRATNSIEATP